MNVLLREDVLAWLSVPLLGACALLAAWQLFWGARRLDLASRWCAGLGSYLLLLSLGARGAQLRAWPLTSTYELILLAVAAMALFFALGVPRRLAAAGGFCAGLGGMLLLVLVLWQTPAGARVPLLPPPALQGIWFPLHTITTAIGYGGLVLAGGAGLFRLALGRRPAREDVPVQPADLDALSWQALAWGYPWLTLGMVLGSLWGWHAWGIYWSWGAKEVLTLLTWGLFTLAFHTRRLKGWQGRPHAAVLAAGLLALLLTLLAAEALVQRLLPTARYIF